MSEGCILSTNKSSASVSSGGGGAEAVGQTCHSGGGALSRTVYQEAAFSNQEGWVLSPGSEPEAIELVHCQGSLQNGGDQYLLSGNDWMASIDLKDAYLLVALKAEHRKYICFVWVQWTYEIQCHPFGLSSTSRVFIKLLKPVVSLLRHQGILLVIFLDDMLVLV